MKDFAKSIRTNNSVPGSWVKTRTVDGPAQEKEFKNYSLIVQEDKDEERGKTWWSWYVYRGNSEIASGESNSENEAKSKAESWLEHSVPMPTGNSKVGNGSGSWRGKFYEDSAGNSASLEKRGEGWEVYWEDSRGYGKPLGTYKDERTAREVAEVAVESEMPDRIRASYKSKAINSKVGNYMMDPSGQVEDLIKMSEKYIASKDKDGAKRLWGSMEIAFRQLKEDKEEHYKKYQEADDLSKKLNQAAIKLKSIL